MTLCVFFSERENKHRSDLKVSYALVSMGIIKFLFTGIILILQAQEQLPEIKTNTISKNGRLGECLSLQYEIKQKYKKAEDNKLAFESKGKIHSHFSLEIMARKIDWIENLSRVGDDLRFLIVEEVGHLLKEFTEYERLRLWRNFIHASTQQYTQKKIEKIIHKIELMSQKNMLIKKIQKGPRDERSPYKKTKFKELPINYDQKSGIIQKCLIVKREKIDLINLPLVCFEINLRHLIYVGGPYYRTQVYFDQNIMDHYTFDGIDFLKFPTEGEYFYQEIQKNECQDYLR